MQTLILNEMNAAPAGGRSTAVDRQPADPSKGLTSARPSSPIPISLPAPNCRRERHFCLAHGRHFSLAAAGKYLIGFIMVK